MRRTLATLLPAALAAGLIGLAIASDRGSSASAVGIATPQPASAPAPAPAPPRETVVSPTRAMLAEMTRRLGTPPQVRREQRRRARELARIEARIRARQRAAAAAAAAARQAAATTWSDPGAAAIASSNPTSPAEAAWLQGGYGGWVEPSGFARAPVNAPDAVKRVIAAGNQIARAPYLWGGGHGAWQDKGYDCSGSVSYALAAGGLLGYSLTSGQLMNWGAPGPGKWLTVYANDGHVFMYVAGLRFDTSGRAGDHASRWQLANRSAAGFVARHYPGL